MDVINRWMQLIFSTLTATKLSEFAKSTEFLQQEVSLINKALKSITKFLVILLFLSFNFSLLYANIEIDTPDIDGDKKSFLSYLSRVFLF